MYLIIFEHTYAQRHYDKDLHYNCIPALILFSIFMKTINGIKSQQYSGTLLVHCFEHF